MVSKAFSLRETDFSFFVLGIGSIGSYSWRNLQLRAFMNFSFLLAQ